jgi:mannose-6-phosphate isomerase-like protein (cupin superfamily)
MKDSKLTGELGLFKNKSDPHQVMAKKETYDYLAPDTSEIRLLPRMNGGNILHCTLRSGKVSIPVKHKTVEELWYVITGTGKMWLLDDQAKHNGEFHDLYPGVAIAIPPKTAFQFRNTGDSEPLEIVITTMPPWPGAAEAVTLTSGPWDPTVDKKEDKGLKGNV